MQYFNRTMLVAISVALYIFTTSIVQMVNQANQQKVKTIHVEVVKRAITKKDYHCLVKNVYHEAANQGYAGMVAVTQVTLNRYESGKHGDTICQVVYEKNQFSWVKDASIRNKPMNKAMYKQCENVVKDVLLNGKRNPELIRAMHYHATYINKPTWAYSKKVLGIINQHIFYT